MEGFHNIHGWAKDAGFDDCGWTALDSPHLDSASRALKTFLEKEYHGTMGWMERPARSHPNALWGEAKTAIALAANYTPAENPLKALARTEEGVISVYAQRQDYHRVLSKQTKAVASLIAQHFSCKVKTFVDTAPLMEKPLSALAGLGWQGKHSNLVSKKLGSWFFLSIILTDLPPLRLSPSIPKATAPRATAPIDNCGSCQQCLDICPTQAFIAPYQLDARKCISYLTIEHKGHIDRIYRKALGNRIYGCDDCLAVCPWNKFATQTKQMAGLDPDPELTQTKLADFLTLDEEGFAARFRHNPIKRIGLARFLRNVLLAAGNSHTHALLGLVKARLTHEEAIVRLAAVWACRELASAAAFTALQQTFSPKETDPEVLAEWRYRES